MHRRQFLLLTAGAASATTGCSSIRGPTHESASDEAISITDEFENRYAYGAQLELTLESGTYAQLGPFQAPKHLDLSVDVGSGVIDLWTMKAAEYENAYQQGDDVTFLTELSAPEVASTGSVQGWIEGDDVEYQLAVDNTAVYGAEPSGDAEMTLDLVSALATEKFFAYKDWLDSEGIEYTQFGVAEGLNWWLLSYEFESREPTDDEVATVRSLVLKYSDFLPDRNPKHTGLELGLGTNGSQIEAFEIPAQLARRYRDEEITEQEYLERAVPLLF